MKIEATKTIHSDTPNAIIDVYENLPNEFNVKRIFRVFKIGRELRGNHANKKTNQYMICTSGWIDITLKNKEFPKGQKISLLATGIAYIPKNTWVEYSSADGAFPGSVLVICDQPYDANEYYTNYEEFERECIKNK